MEGSYFIGDDDSFYIPNRGNYVPLSELELQDFIYLLYKDLKDTLNFNFSVYIRKIYLNTQVMNINLKISLKIDDLIIGLFDDTFIFKNIDDAIQNFSVYRDISIMSIEDRLNNEDMLYNNISTQDKIYFGAGDIVFKNKKNMHISMLITDFNKKKIYESFDELVEILIKIKTDNNS